MTWDGPRTADGWPDYDLTPEVVAKWRAAIADDDRYTAFHPHHVTKMLDLIDSLTAENERLREALTKLHTPTDQEVEVWADGPGEDFHDEFLCDGGDCRGHVKVIQVCQECGYDLEDGYPVLREWPCPTLRALDESEER